MHTLIMKLFAYLMFKAGVLKLSHVPSLKSFYLAIDPRGEENYIFFRVSRYNYVRGLKIRLNSKVYSVVNIVTYL